MRIPTPTSRVVLAVPLAALCLLAFRPQDPDRQDPSRRGRGPMADVPDLVAALEKTEGCLGVDAGQMRSGKQVIFAWFEDKQAVLRWYRSRTHREVMKRFVKQREHKKPLALIDDDSGPIMVVASLTMSDKPRFDALSLPVSQIAIELYQPLPGGTYLGGRFTPMAVEVEGSRDYLAEDDDEHGGKDKDEDKDKHKDKDKDEQRDEKRGERRDRLGLATR